MGDSYVEILSWKKYNGRNDVDRPSWFRCQNSIFFDEKFNDFSLEEIGVFVFLMSYASTNQTGVFRNHVARLAGFARTSETVFREALSKLEREGVIAFHSKKFSDGSREDDVTSTERERSSTEKDGDHGDLDPPAAEKFNFQKILKAYPRVKAGKPGWEKAALTKLRDEITSAAQFEAVEKAVANFAKYHRELAETEEKFVPYFLTFFERWKNWIFVTVEGSPVVDTVKPCDLRGIVGSEARQCWSHKMHEQCGHRLSQIGVTLNSS